MSAKSSYIPNICCLGEMLRAAHSAAVQTGQLHRLFASRPEVASASLPGSNSGPSLKPAPQHDAMQGAASFTSQEVVSSNLKSPEYERALELARRQQYDEARDAFEQLVQQQPSHTKAWISYAQMQKKRWMPAGQSIALQACREVLDRGMQANPEAAQIVQAAGLAELQGGRGAAAAVLLQRAVAMDASLAPVLQWKAVKQALAGTRTSNSNSNSSNIGSTRHQPLEDIASSGSHSKETDIPPSGGMG